MHRSSKIQIQQIVAVSQTSHAQEPTRCNRNTEGRGESRIANQDGLCRKKTSRPWETERRGNAKRKGSSKTFARVMGGQGVAKVQRDRRLETKKKTSDSKSTHEAKGGGADPFSENGGRIERKDRKESWDINGKDGSSCLKKGTLEEGWSKIVKKRR